MASGGDLQQALNTLTAQANANAIQNAEQRNIQNSRDINRSQNISATNQQPINTINTTTPNAITPTINVPAALQNTDVNLFGNNALAANRNVATTNTGLGVTLSPEAREAINQLRTTATTNNFKLDNMARIIDGKMPFTPILFTEFRYTDNTVGQLFQKKVVETFNDIMQGGRNGTPVRSLKKKKKEEEYSEAEKAKKPFNVVI